MRQVTRTPDVKLTVNQILTPLQFQLSANGKTLYAKADCEITGMPGITGGSIVFFKPADGAVSAVAEQVVEKKGPGRPKKNVVETVSTAPVISQAEVMALRAILAKFA